MLETILGHGLIKDYPPYPSWGSQSRFLLPWCQLPNEGCVDKIDQAIKIGILLTIVATIPCIPFSSKLACPTKMREKWPRGITVRWLFKKPHDLIKFNKLFLWCMFKSLHQNPQPLGSLEIMEGINTYFSPTICNTS